MAMTIQEAVAKVHDYMERNARAVAEGMAKEGLVPSYKAKAHSAAAGRVIAHCFGQGLEVNEVNATVLFHSLANHSAWRQKFEKKGLFPASGEKKEVDPKKAQDKVARLMEELAGVGGVGVTETETAVEGTGTETEA